VRRAVAIAIVLASSSAHAEDVCDDPIADPVPLAVRSGGFDATRSACLRADVDVRLGAHALIDTPGFYGTLGGGLQIGIRFLESFGLEWGATVDVVDLTFAQTAVVTATDATYGPITIHGALGRPVGERLRLAALARADVPFTRSSLDSSSAGVQLAGLATYRAASRVAVHGRAGLLGWYASSPGGTSTRAAAVVSADAAIRTWWWLDAIAGVETQAGWYGLGLDHVAARVGAHAHLGAGPWRLDVGAMLPLAGTERTNLVFTLGLLRDR
jgi:hypothetical protein